MTEWKDIATAPMDTTRILVYCGYITEAWWNGCAWETEEILSAKATHWMELPPKPDKKCLNERWVVYHKEDGIFAWQCNTGLGSSKVNFCPICGEKANE